MKAASTSTMTFRSEMYEANPSIERTSDSGLRPLSAAAHVKR